MPVSAIFAESERIIIIGVNRWDCYLFIFSLLFHHLCTLAVSTVMLYCYKSTVYNWCFTFWIWMENKSKWNIKGNLSTTAVCLHKCFKTLFKPIFNISWRHCYIWSGVLTLRWQIYIVLFVQFIRSKALETHTILRAWTPFCWKSLKHTYPPNY